jgi:hypothetical protein
LKNRRNANIAGPGVNKRVPESPLIFHFFHSSCQSAKTTIFEDRVEEAGRLVSVTEDLS